MGPAARSSVRDGRAGHRLSRLRARLALPHQPALAHPTVQQLQHNEQYGTGWTPRAVPWTLHPQNDPPGTELRLDGAGGKSYLAFEEKLPDLGWTLTVTADSRVVALARQQAWALATLASGLLVLGALYWQLRERRLAENRLARIELEQRVQERTHALQQAQAFRQSMEDSLLVGMRARDLEGRIVYVNAAMCDMVGYRADELIGQLPPYPYWHPDELDRHWNDSDTVLAGNAFPQGRENRLRHRDGSDVYTMFYTTRLIDGSGQHIGWMSSVVNITAQKRAEEQQQQRETQLQRVQRVITVGEMASTLAHELNQPLAALVNYAAAARALAAQGKTGPLHDSLEALSAQALRAADIVGRIRRWVRQHPESREPCDLSAIVEQSLELLLRAEARRQGIPVRVEQAGAPLPVNADRVLLEQVVINLGLNALQAMQTHQPPPGGHELRLRMAADDGQALVQVLDRGPGLPPGIAERLFEPFFTTRSDGLGLGLNICRSIIESMGANYRPAIAKAAARSSRSACHAPRQRECHRAMTYDTAPIAADSLDPTAVYIVDDDEGVRQSLAALLLARGYTVRAFDGGEAFLAQAALDHPGCVLLDLRMEGLSGLQVFHELGQRHSALKTVFLSAHGELSSAVAAVKQGAVDWLENRATKPLCWPLSKRPPRCRKRKHGRHNGSTSCASAGTP